MKGGSTRHVLKRGNEIQQIIYRDLLNTKTTHQILQTFAWSQGRFEFEWIVNNDSCPQSLEKISVLLCCYGRSQHDLPGLAIMSFDLNYT